MSRVFRDHRNNNSSVVLVSVRSSYCQTEPLEQESYSPPKKVASLRFLPAPQPVTCCTQQRKIQRKHRTKEKRNMPFEVMANVHSDRTLNKIDYFLSKYIDQLYSDKHHLY